MYAWWICVSEMNEKLFKVVNEGNLAVGSSTGKMEKCTYISKFVVDNALKIIFIQSIALVCTTK